MPSPIRIVSPQLQVPVLDAPRLKSIDVSSGLEAVAGGLNEFARVEQAAQLNDTQIDLSRRFRGLADELRSTPAEEKKQLFEERAAQIHKEVFGSANRQLRQAAEPDFHRSYAAFGARVDAEAWQGIATNSLAKADAEAGELINQIAATRVPHVRDWLVTQLGTLYANLAAVNVIDDATRRARTSGALNKADLLAARATIDDPAHDPVQVAKTLRERRDYFHLHPAEAQTLARRADSEAIRRQGLAAADARTADAVTLQQAPKIVRDNATSIMTTGRPLDDDSLAVIDRLPKDQQPQLRAQIDGAGIIFRTVGDLRTQSALEIAKSLEKLQPLGDAVHNQAIAFANKILADRNRDPAAATGAIPTVAKAWTAYDQNPTAENLQIALAASQASQTTLGVPPEQQRLLPESRAEAEARTILDAAPADQLKALRDLRARYGSNAPAILQQIEGFFPPGLQEADTQASRLKGELMWRNTVATASRGDPMAGVRDGVDGAIRPPFRVAAAVPTKTATPGSTPPLPRPKPNPYNRTIKSATAQEVRTLLLWLRYDPHNEDALQEFAWRFGDPGAYAQYLTPEEAKQLPVPGFDVYNMSQPTRGFYEPYDFRGGSPAGPNGERLRDFLQDREGTWRAPQFVSPKVPPIDLDRRLRTKNGAKQHSTVFDPFGNYRIGLTTGAPRPHLGLDYYGPIGTPIRAQASGRVSVGTATGYGEVVIVSHPDGLHTMSAHLGSVYVKPGDWVAAGTIIGTLGISGRSNDAATRRDAHLHTEVLVDDVTNPDGSINNGQLPGALRIDPVIWARMPMDTWYHGSITAQPVERGQGKTGGPPGWYSGNLLPPQAKTSD